MIKNYITPVIASLPLFFGTFEKEVPKVEVHEYVESVQEVIQVIEEVKEKITFNVDATFYTSDCYKCIGITKMGHDVRGTIYVNGMRVIAVDPNLIPLGSKVFVELENGESFKAIASDTGGKIKFSLVDILVYTKEEAFSLGRMKAKVTILE